MTRKQIVVLFCGSMLFAAQLSCGEDCGTEEVAGLAVTIKDGQRGTTICDATVTATDGDYSETLEVSGAGEGCVYYGAYERTGVYKVEATKYGYRTASEETDVVKYDCHVVQRELELTLSP